MFEFVNEAQRNQVIVSVMKCVRQMNSTAIFLEIMKFRVQGSELSRKAEELEAWLESEIEGKCDGENDASETKDNSSPA